MCVLYPRILSSSSSLAVGASLLVLDYPLKLSTTSHARLFSLLLFKQGRTVQGLRKIMGDKMPSTLTPPITKTKRQVKNRESCNEVSAGNTVSFPKAEKILAMKNEDGDEKTPILQLNGCPCDLWRVFPRRLSGGDSPFTIQDNSS